MVGNEESVQGSSCACALDRREFMRLTLMSGAMLATAGVGVEANAEETLAAAPKFAVLTELAPGAVRPEGWLKVYLDKQAAELGSKLPLISSLKDFASVGGKKVVYGSPNDAASPWIAP